MGYNTVFIAMNDALDRIANDPEFGSKLRDAERRRFMNRGSVDISSGGFVNAASVVGVEHADVVQIIAVGGNSATVLGKFHNGGNHHSEADQIDLLRKLAEQYGFVLHRNNRLQTERAKTLWSERNRNAERAYEKFEFDRTVGDDEGFEYTSPGKVWERNVYLENDGDEPSTRVRFCVTFESESSSVIKHVHVEGI